jgi:hypothetical protein
MVDCCSMAKGETQLRWLAVDGRFKRSALILS